MTSQLTEDKVRKAVEKSASFGVDIIVPWITNALTGNDYIVEDISRARFTFHSINSMRFTTTATIVTGPEFNEIITAKFVWTKKNKKLSANLQGVTQ